MTINKELCDFCHRPLAVWHYPCQDFTYKVMGIQDFQSKDFWAACGQCAEYIEKEQMDDLAFLLSGLFTIPGNDPTIEQQSLHNVLYGEFRNMYRLFQAHRAGPRVLA